MGNFDRGGGGRFGGDRGGRGFGGRDSGGGRSWGGGKPWDKQVTMHQAVCSNCGNKCEVPFKPNGSKPVLCNDCFSKAKAGGAPGGNFSPRRDSRDGGGSRDSGFAPSYTPSYQPSQPQGGDKRIDDLKRQLDVVNSKLDTLIKGLEKAALAEMSLEEKKTTLKKLVKKATAPKKTETKTETKKK
ncbi:MAG: CxxC-x17-CxxC domain-containing protein [Patescibacteria group bacterium]|nr:CxxC-x17-CxxC domain-containing protein [Patescibacteria group bacterium]